MEEGENRGGMREGRPWGPGVHAYATISFDYIIVFRPGGIIHVNKLHIFFHSASPLFFVCFSSYCRDFVVVANSQRLFDPLFRFPFVQRDVRDTSLVARLGIILSRTPEQAKVCEVFRWGVGMNEQRAEILNTAGKMEDKCMGALMVHS